MKRVLIVILVCYAFISVSGSNDISDLPINHVDDGGNLLNWTLLGPFHSYELTPEVNLPVGRTGYHRDFLKSIGGEEKAEIKRNTNIKYETLTGKTRTVEAQRVGPKYENQRISEFNHILYETHILEQDYDKSVGYAFCYIRSKDRQEVYAYMGSDGSPKVFLNGKLVFERWEDRISTKTWDNSFKMNLRKGLNRLLVKIDNKRRWWGFQMEVYTKENHEEGIKGALEGITIQELRSDDDTLNFEVELSPQPIDFQVPVKVLLEGGGDNLRQLSGKTGKDFSIEMPQSFSGRAKLTVSSQSESFSDIGKSSRVVYIGDVEDRLEDLENAFKNIDRSNLLSHYGPAWKPIYEGNFKWIDYFLKKASNQSPDSWILSSIRSINRLIKSYRDQKNYLGSHPGRSFPMAMEGADYRGRTVTGRYLVTLPENFGSNGSTYPILIHLYGSGSEKKITYGDENISYFDGISQSAIRVTPIAPHGISHYNNWPIAYLNSILGDVLARFPVDENRVYLQGGSGGGKGTWRWSINNPERFAAMSVLVGFEGKPFRAARLKNVPVWVFNGEQDLASYPALADLMINALRNAGAEVKYSSFPDRPHFVSPAIDKKAWLDWYLQHERKQGLPVPKDPLDTLRWSNGISEIDTVRVREQNLLKMRPLESFTYPQDNIDRSTIKILRSYRLTMQNKNIDRLTNGWPVYELSNGFRDTDNVNLYLDAKIQFDTKKSMLLTTKHVSSFSAIELYVKCGDQWGDLISKKDLIMDKMNYKDVNISERIFAYNISIFNDQGERIWKLLVEIDD